MINYLDLEFRIYVRCKDDELLLATRYSFLSLPPQWAGFYFLLHITITYNHKLQLCTYLTFNVGGSLLPCMSE
jgi:hypothetical protein